MGIIGESESCPPVFKVKKMASRLLHHVFSEWLLSDSETFFILAPIEWTEALGNPVVPDVKLTQRG